MELPSVLNTVDPFLASFTLCMNSQEIAKHGKHAAIDQKMRERKVK